MGRKSRKYTLFQYSVQARLSAHTYTDWVWRNILVFHFVSSSTLNLCWAGNSYSAWRSHEKMNKNNQDSCKTERSTVSKLFYASSYKLKQNPCPGSCVFLSQSFNKSLGTVARDFLCLFSSYFLYPSGCPSASLSV